MKRARLSVGIALFAIGSVASAVAAPEPTVSQLYEACVGDAWPTTDDADARNAACSRALQTRKLVPKEIALARLTRGVARMALGGKVMATDDYAEALKHYEAAIDARNPDARDLTRRATLLEGLGQTERALQDYGEALRRDPENAQAYLGRGRLMAVRKRAYDRAIEDFTKVLALDGRSVDALIARGSARGQLGDAAGAIADLDRAIALSPGRAQPLVERGMLYARRGDTALAIRDFDAALKIHPAGSDGLVNRAAAYARQGRQELAIRDLDDALAIDAGNPVALYNRGYAHFARGEYDKALRDYSLAIAVDPQMGLAYNNRCLVRAILGRDLVRALDDCDTAQKLSPLNLDAAATRGFIYLKLGDPQLALHEYNSLLEMDPNRPIALYGRGLARIAIGQKKEGEGDKAGALVLDPEVAAAFSLYGLK